MDCSEYSHPVFGKCRRYIGKPNPKGISYTRIRKDGPFYIDGLDLNFPQLKFFLKDILEPAKDVVEDVKYLLNFPKHRKEEVENIILEEYRKELYPIYYEIYSQEWKMSDQEIEKVLPRLDSSQQVWRLFGEPRGISCGTWNYVVLSFFCNFDEEHDLHLGFSNNKLDRVWTE